MSDWVTPDQVKAAMKAGTGREVRIAVLDSGVEIGHPHFQRRCLAHDLIVDVNKPISRGDGVDLYGHGTAVAGLIWDIAPEACIGSFRVLGKDLRARSAQISLAAKEAIKLGYDILNCSFGCGIPGHLAFHKEWVDRAYLAGVHVVAATCSYKSPEWPANFTSVFGVDCCEEADDDTPLYHRNGHIIEFAAPAREQKVTWKNGSYRTMIGSSFASASLTGLLARILSIHKIDNPLIIKALLRRVCASLSDHKPASIANKTLMECE